MRGIAIFLILAEVVTSQNCINGYTAGTNGMCRKYFGPSQAKNRYDAAATCAYDSSRLVKIDNAFTNNEIQTMAGAYEMWIGVKCATSDLKTCGYDDGTYDGKNYYSNFAPGWPEDEVGTCVVLSGYSGKWFSKDCTKVTTVFICEYDPKVRGNASCSGVSPYQDSEKQQILQIHNDLRSQIALGKFVANTTKKPSATNMQMMTWSCELENSAQAIAEHCTFDISKVPPGPITNFRFNEYRAVALNLGIGKFKGSGISAVNNWESAFQKHGWPSNQMSQSLVNLGIQYATQMAWWNSNQIGCGVVECPRDFINANNIAQRNVFCLYLSQGDMMGQMIYNEGPTCSACAAGFVCDKPTGLCKQQ